MVSSFISRLVILIFGTLYPAYASYKAVRTKNVKEYVKWMMYWIVFALFTCAETFTDLFLSFWFPFYYEIKIITVIYLLSPATKGSSILYRKFVHPTLIKREQEIDEYIAKAKEQGYHTMLNLGSKGVTYATSLIMQTAIKGGGGLVNQLRKSYSLGDLSQELNLRNVGEPGDDEADRLIRRNLAQSPCRPNSTGEPLVYFPENETYHEPYDDYYSEEISSGYSSRDPLYYPRLKAQGVRNQNLVRTASLGPSSRIRTRAAAKSGLPNRSSLSEGGSSWPALEPHESQIESEGRITYPLSHRASFPLPFFSLQRAILPECYQQMLENSNESQMFAFINYPQSQVFNNNQTVNFEAPLKILESNKSESCSNSVLNSNENISDSRDKITEEKGVVNCSDPSDLINTEVLNETKESNEKEKTSTDSEVLRSSYGLDVNAKSLLERSGKYRKKPAPAPPVEEPNSKATLSVTAEDEEAQFYTPNASPKLVRKHSSSSVGPTVERSCSECDREAKAQDSDSVEVKRKEKTVVKKGDFNIHKKLHMVKMFSFRHQKGAKQPPVPDNSYGNVRILN